MFDLARDILTLCRLADGSRLGSFRQFVTIVHWKPFPAFWRATVPDILAKLREICLALPGAEETITFGHPTFRATGKAFAVLEEYKGELSIDFRVERSRQERRQVGFAEMALTARQLP
jgi:hypothetical protein